MQGSRVVVLAGGTGGARLARGFAALDQVELTVIANPGDDIDVYGAHVSPDPDLVAFTLADLIDERGWGLLGDTFKTMDGLRDVGVDVWFNLGDRDLALCIERARLLATGSTPNQALAAVFGALGIPATVIVPCDQQIRTVVTSNGRRLPFQEYMIRHQPHGPVESFEFEGAESATIAAEARAALDAADVIVIGPSNPIASIGPILAIHDVRSLLATTSTPVVAVSPIVGGEVLKGPTLQFLAANGTEASSTGIAGLYDDLLDGIVTDEETEAATTHLTDTHMRDIGDQQRLASEVLAFGLELAKP